MMLVPIGDFLRDMGRPLRYREPTTRNNFWVFWSHEEGEGGGVETLTNDNWNNVQEYLKYLLCKAECIVWGKVALIQFWAPTPTTTTSTIGRRWVLTTSNQPFGLYGLERRICEYRKHCTSLEFNIPQDKEDNEDEFGGVISRVYMYKKAKSRLLGDLAPKYGIWGSYFLPLFKPSGGCCSGVLEISVTFHSSLFDFDLYILAEVIFKEAKFTRPPSLELQQSTEIEEINKALQGVCTTLYFSLAQIWIPCCTSTAMAYVDKPGELCHSPYLSCSNKFSSSISQNGDSYDHYCLIREFNFYCEDLKFRKGQSIVGKALLYHKPSFCWDVTQLPEAEHPFSDYEEISEFGGCCAIWLHSTRTNHDYVLQFLFAPWDKFCGVLQSCLELLLATVKKQLPGFKISSVGEESCVEVYEISVKKQLPGLEQNGIVVCYSEKTAGEELFVEAATDDEITRKLPPMPESLRNENEVVLSDDEPTMEEAVRMNELNVGIDEAVTSSERIFSRAEASEREYRTTDITLSREDLTKHFGKKLADAAKILNVSRSTVKRACRLHNIDKWPVPKRKKVNALRVRSGNEGIEGTYKGDPSSYDPPPTPTTAGISHKTTNSRQEQDAGTVTVKATVKKQLLGFKISSVGEESCVEICETYVNDDKPDSVRISQTFNVKPVPKSFVNETDTVQNEVVGETDIDNGSNILGLEQNGIDVWYKLFVEAGKNDEITIRLPPMPESLRNENEVVHQQSDDEPTMEEGVRKNELNVAIVKKTNAAVTSSERIFSRAEASEREYRTADITLSYEDLRKHFGKKLDDAAKILEVSRSTMKRVCRRHNIKKWPAPKRNKVNVLCVCSGNEGIEGTYRGDPSCSHPSPTPTTASISHETSNSRQEQDVGTMTVKATYGGHTIQFGLPFLSRKTDLVKQVIKRLPLNEGSFNIKYQDEENDWILIACDEDLEQCIGIWKGKGTIKMLVQPKTNQTP